MNRLSDNRPPSQSRLTIEDAHGRQATEIDGGKRGETLIAADAEGNSLTLLEEYAARRNKRPVRAELAFSLFCATASLAFAALIYFKTL
ncbi:hypothetical protein [Pelagicoccus sp. SDUM812003]|uniref:hypothetical protein n=1 Tax=Pelagicoccus sp. SDUM812003 TaxID=3041267 RepID=UPI00281064DA|nr:hypothetical protein [Pelagicoccus sp. SDUM812003]MDQ8205134.1 hypothetical protein [Pelagicoccus sp. SDUM812003]